MKLPTIFVVLTIAATLLFQSDRQKMVQACAAEAGEGAIYLREFVVDLPKSERDGQPAMYRQAVVLRGNNIYRFNLCNQKGEAVLRIYDSSNMILSTYDANTNKEFNPINFLCRKTGQYNIVITFKNGKAGETIGIMSHVSK
ncbi:MAG: hypothetical protein JXR52_07705 [Bacteroidales bacterium]|nr:hypothetical protein [Bacteroidales bacterium]MBN2698695.1 hypothetical protein [Bacteroidales bacterium]